MSMDTIDLNKKRGIAERLCYRITVYIYKYTTFKKKKKTKQKAHVQAERISHYGFSGVSRDQRRSFLIYVLQKRKGHGADLWYHQIKLAS